MEEMLYTCEKLKVFIAVFLESLQNITCLLFIVVVN